MATSNTIWRGQLSGYGYLPPGGEAGDFLIKTAETDGAAAWGTSVFDIDRTGESPADSAIQDAINALPASGGIIYLPPGTYRQENTWTTEDSKPVIFKGAGVKTKIDKQFNGDSFSLGAQSQLIDLYIEGNGATRTGRGVVVSTGSLDETSWRKFRHVSILNMEGHCIEFTQARAGYSSMMEMCRMTTYGQEIEAVKCPDSEPNNGNRFMVGCWTFGTPLCDFGGCDNMTLVGCQGAFPTFGADSKKVSICGGRIVNNGTQTKTNWTIQGTNHSITGIVSGVSTLTFNSALFKSTFRGNSIASGTIYADTSRGISDGNIIDIPLTAYLPTWSATAGTTPAIGNGTYSASYERIGERCIVDIRIVGASDTAWGSGGYWVFSVPYQASREATGTCYIEDASGVTTYVGTARILASTTEIFVALNNASAYLTYNNPIASPAVNDKITINISYPIK